MSVDDHQLYTRHLSALHAFILRARRVEQHPMAAEREVLPKLAVGHGTVQVHSSGDTYFVQELPPEVLVESAAARIRPLILNDDPTFHAKALQAIGYFIRRTDASDAAKALHSELKAGWNTIKPQGRDATGYYLQVCSTGSPATAQATDNVLGFAWIYGDVVHHDLDRLTETRTFGVSERFRAAVPLIARIMMLTINSLTVIRALQKGGVIPAIPGAHETEVVVADTTFRLKGEIYVSDPVTDGAPISVPPIDQPLGAEWRRFQEAFHPTGAAGSAASEGKDPSDTAPLTSDS